jgi:Leucine-rich repeat (LRR) protein
MAESLAISNTLIGGPLDGTVFRKLSRLQYLDIGDNYFNSTMPQAIARLPNLRELHADNCGLHGKVERFLPLMTTLIKVRVDHNFELSGTIPPSVGNLTNLESLSFGNCDLRGQIPTEVGRMTNLHHLWLYGNWLSGTIPSEIGLLTKLTIFGIEDNVISNAAMPQEVCKLNLFALSSDCGYEFPSVDCDCCTCCEAPCPQNTHKVFDGL